MHGIGVGVVLTVGSPLCVQGTFLECVSTLRPSVIVGVSAQPGSFSTEVLKLMAELHAQPLVFALSNPTSKVCVRACSCARACVCVCVCVCL